jgi:hypothetical protein
MCKNEELKHSTHSELYFVFCFILIPCLRVKIQTWRHYFLKTLCHFFKHLLGLHADPPIVDVYK